MYWQAVRDHKGAVFSIRNSHGRSLVTAFFEGPKNHPMSTLHEIYAFGDESLTDVGRQDRELAVGWLQELEVSDINDDANKSLGLAVSVKYNISSFDDDDMDSGPAYSAHESMYELESAKDDADESAVDEAESEVSEMETYIEELFETKSELEGQLSELDDKEFEDETERADSEEELQEEISGVESELENGVDTLEDLKSDLREAQDRHSQAVEHVETLEWSIERDLDEVEQNMDRLLNAIGDDGWVENEDTGDALYTRYGPDVSRRQTSYDIPTPKEYTVSGDCRYSDGMIEVTLTVKVEISANGTSMHAEVEVTDGDGYRRGGSSYSDVESAFDEAFEDEISTGGTMSLRDLAGNIPNEVMDIDELQQLFVDHVSDNAGLPWS